MSQQEFEVLLVEDNSDDLELALRALQRGKVTIRIQVVRDGEEALDFIFCRGKHKDRTFYRPPRFVLLDLKLPKINGLEVLRAIKNDPRTRAIPVILMTSSTEQRDMVEGYQQGVNSFIQKPVDYSEFREVISQLGVYWLAVNQPPPREAFLQNPHTPAVLPP